VAIDVTDFSSKHLSSKRFSRKHGRFPMAHFLFVASAFSALGLPIVAILALLIAKLSTGASARRAERRFLAVLVIMSVVTAHTVFNQNAAWLIHTTTLGLLIVGSLWIPGQAAYDEADETNPLIAG
jgi:hypothetical protein